MVLGPQGPGRVGRRRFFMTSSPSRRQVAGARCVSRRVACARGGMIVPGGASVAQLRERRRRSGTSARDRRDAVLWPGGRDAGAAWARGAQRLAVRMRLGVGCHAVDEILGTQHRFRHLGEAVRYALKAWGEHVFAKLSGCADGSPRCILLGPWFVEKPSKMGDSGGGFLQGKLQMVSWGSGRVLYAGGRVALAGRASRLWCWWDVVAWGPLGGSPARPYGPGCPAPPEPRPLRLWRRWRRALGVAVSRVRVGCAGEPPEAPTWRHNSAPDHERLDRRTPHAHRRTAAEEAQTPAIVTCVSRKLLPDGSRKPESMP